MNFCTLLPFKNGLGFLTTCAFELLLSEQEQAVGSTAGRQGHAEPGSLRTTLADRTMTCSLPLMW